MDKFEGAHASLEEWVRWGARSEARRGTQNTVLAPGLGKMNWSVDNNQ